jgi:Arc/MetJ-type ribon-helix-helix transcriptional regulator
MEKPRITVQISFEEQKKIEETIKSEYPRLKTISDLVRAALKEFLSEKASWKKPL